MKVSELELKVAKAQEKVDKTKKTIERHEAQLAKKIALLEKASGRELGKFYDARTLDTFKWDANDGHKAYPYYWEACDVGSKLEDIKGSKKKLVEAEQILTNWKVKLENEQNKDSFLEMNTPQVIKDFLEQWKELVLEWSIKRHADYLELKAKLKKEASDVKREYVKAHMKEEVADMMERYDESEEKAIETVLKYRKSRALDTHMKEQRLDYDSISARLINFAGTAVIHMDSIRNEEERLAWLDKELEKEKKAKMLDLVFRINEVVGTITDAKGLYISQAGNINGFIIGTQGKATIETIGAGGYNIQRFHYRTLINKIK